jgi:hypothetical protein
VSAPKGRRTARAKSDPIFALIAKHAKAVKAFGRAEASLSRLRQRLDARKGEACLDPSRRLTSKTPPFDVGRPNHPATVVTTRDGLTRHVWRAFDEIALKIGPRTASRVRAHEREAVAELQRRYGSFMRAHKARRKACGLTKRERAAEDADLAASLALNALMKAVPTTPEGRAALANHLCNLGPRAAPWWALRDCLARLSNS